jgi:hypothetical protein
MATFSQGGTLGTAIETAEIVDGNVTASKLAATALTAHLLPITSVTPRPWAPCSGQNATAYSVNTTMYVALVHIPHRIVANSISFAVDTVGAAGVLKLALYSEDGQTLVIPSTSTASISAGGVITTALSAIDIPAGNYWLAVVSSGTANITASSWLESTDVNGLTYNTTGEPVLIGTVTVTASTIPATITPASVTHGTRCLFARLDN